MPCFILAFAGWDSLIFYSSVQNLPENLLMQFLYSLRLIQIDLRQIVGNVVDTGIQEIVPCLSSPGWCIFELLVSLLQVNGAILVIQSLNDALLDVILLEFLQSQIVRHSHDIYELFGAIQLFIDGYRLDQKLINSLLSSLRFDILYAID